SKGRFVYRFELETIQDIYGNRVQIEYAPQTNSIADLSYTSENRPSRIAYTTNPNLGISFPSRAVMFNYTPTHEVSDGYRIDYPGDPEQESAFQSGPAGRIYGYQEAIDSINILLSDGPFAPYNHVRTI